jgi:hypothetical protein
MATSDQQRHFMIGQAVRRAPGSDDDVDLRLWQSLALELRVIIGERGFESMYARSLHLAAAASPWLASETAQSGDAFALLAARLKQRPAAEAQAASAALLNIFIDTLIVLIGELLTYSILRKAWGDDVVNQAATEHRT